MVIVVVVVPPRSGKGMEAIPLHDPSSTSAPTS
jgi:hypothetical protein